MTPFEQDLRKALARSEPAEDFTRRVLAAARDLPPRRTRFAWFAPPLGRLVSVAMLAIVLFSAAFGYRQHVHHVKGEAAKEQLLMALQIAGAQLRSAQIRVQQIENSEVVVQ